MSLALLEDQIGSARWLTINRPEKRNALNNDVIAALSDALRRADKDASVRAIVLTGAGDRAFCAGADLQPRAAFDGIASSPRAPYADMLRAARLLTKPLIARVNGACAAGGLGLVCMADFAVACDDAKFALPEVRIGLIPAQVLSLLVDIVPDRTVRLWSLTGSAFTAEEAMKGSLLTRVVPRASLDAAVNDLLEQLGEASPVAIERGKYTLAALADMSFEQRVAFAEGQIGLALLTADAREGLDAFNARRPPVWSR